jgi:CelD/BcsL family acetyltransferase involved in cellulose biosynthesis
MPALNISLVTTTEEFNSLKTRWNELLRQSSSDVIFLKWEWLYNWWKVYGGGSNRLFVILVQDGDELLGIAPLYIRKRHPSSLNEINFLGSNIVCSDYLDFILLKSGEKETLGKILVYIKEEEGLWDVMNFNDMPSDSSNVNILRSFFENNRTDVNWEYTTCPYIRMTSEWESVYENYPSRLRNTIKRKLKKFEGHYGGSFFIAGRNENVDGYFDEFVRLNLLRMDDKNINSPFLDRQFLMFHKNVVNAMHKEGNVELCFLRVGGKMIAGIYLLYYNNRYYYYQAGYDPSWSMLSPGTLLYHYCIKRAFDRGADEFDFLRGVEPYKYDWTNEQRMNIKISVYGNTLNGYCLHRMKNIKGTIKKGMKNLGVRRGYSKLLNTSRSHDKK